MQIIEFISYSILPIFILLILFGCLAKKISAYDSFTSGVSESLSTILKIFPTMLAVVIAVNLFKTSGAMTLFVNLFEPIFSVFNIPAEVVPLGLMRSISGRWFSCSFK
jgi:spore maturation protein B